MENEPKRLPQIERSDLAVILVTLVGLQLQCDSKAASNQLWIAQPPIHLIEWSIDIVVA